MNYYLYQITNKVNQKIYVGVHKTQSLDDGYMGSGKVLKRAIEKHGLENFEKAILETFDSAEAMFAREKEVVDETFLARADVYNLRRGGSGGFDYINSNRTTEEWSRIGKLARAKSPGNIGKARTAEWLLNMSNSLKGREPAFKGKTHTNESRARIGLANSSSRGLKNSQYGSFWIADGTNSKKVKGDIPEGWRRGRIMP